MSLYTCLLKRDANRLMKTLAKFKRIFKEENRHCSVIFDNGRHETSLLQI